MGLLDKTEPLSFTGQTYSPPAPPSEPSPLAPTPLSAATLPGAPAGVMPPLGGPGLMNKDVPTSMINERTPDPHNENGELPLWQDIAIATGAGLAGTAMAGASGFTGTGPAIAMSAGLYTAAKYALTGAPPKPRLTSLIPGSETMYGPLLGTAEELALWAVAPYLMKPLGAGVKGLAKGVDKVVRATMTPITDATAPAADWAMRNILVKPLSVELPGINKSIVEMLQPAIERIETKLPEVAKTFRANTVEKSLINEVAKDFGKAIEGESPKTLYEISKGLAQPGIKATTKDLRAKELLVRLKSDIKEQSLDAKYAKNFQQSLIKFFPEPVDISAREFNKVFGSMTSGKDASVAEIHKTLASIIENPASSDKARILARDLYNMPYSSPVQIAKASRDASFTYLTEAIKKFPGAFSDTLKKGYVESSFGKLSGAIIHKDVEIELQNMDKLAKIAEDTYTKFFLTPWKTSKVIMRPSSHLRNMVSNVLLNDWGGLPFYRGDIYVDAMKGIRQNSNTWREFQRLTGSNISFTATDMNQLDTGLKYGAGMMDKALNIFDKVAAPARSLYNAEESLFKYGKYLHNLERGMGKVEAAADSIKWTFNFGEVTPEIAYVGKYFMPFVRWYSKVIPMGVETAMKHPLRMGKWAAFGAALQSHALEKTSMSKEEWGDVKKNLPEYMQRGMYLLMPWRDHKDNLNLLDMTNVMPFYGDVSELFQKSPVESILQNPVFNAAAAIKDNKKFSGAPLYYEWEDGRSQWAKIGAYAWEQLMPVPSFTPPFGTDYKRLHDAFSEKGNLSPEQAIGAAMGFKLIPVDEMANKKRKRAITKIYDQEIMSQVKKEFKNNPKISEQEQADALKKARDYKLKIRGMEEQK